MSKRVLDFNIVRISSFFLVTTTTTTTTHSWNSYDDYEEDDTFSSPIVIIVIVVSVISVIIGCLWCCVKNSMQSTPHNDNEENEEARRPMNRPSPASQPRLIIHSRHEDEEMHESSSNINQSNGHLPDAVLTGKMFSRPLVIARFKYLIPLNLPVCKDRKGKKGEL